MAKKIKTTPKTTVFGQKKQKNKLKKLGFSYGLEAFIGQCHDSGDLEAVLEDLQMMYEELQAKIDDDESLLSVTVGEYLEAMAELGPTA